MRNNHKFPYFLLQLVDSIYYISVVIRLLVNREVNLSSCWKSVYERVLVSYKIPASVKMYSRNKQFRKREWSRNPWEDHTAAMEAVSSGLKSQSFFWTSSCSLSLTSLLEFHLVSDHKTLFSNDQEVRSELPIWGI